jgi:hypothetical protein
VITRFVRSVKTAGQDRLACLVAVAGRAARLRPGKKAIPTFARSGESAASDPN